MVPIVDAPSLGLRAVLGLETLVGVPALPAAVNGRSGALLPLLLPVPRGFLGEAFTVPVPRGP